MNSPLLGLGLAYSIYLSHSRDILFSQRQVYLDWHPQSILYFKIIVLIGGMFLRFTNKTQRRFLLLC